jgi:SulP family sulfate permease
MGATLVNLASGGQTRVSGVIEGVLALIAFLVLGAFIAWIPVAALAGILIVVGIRMIDLKSLHLLESSWTMLDFAVIMAVVAVALVYSLIAASAVGIALAMFLFIREQLTSTIIRNKLDGSQRFSKRVRLGPEMDLLVQRGSQTAIVELQGSLFFGTKDQLYSALEPELGKRNYIVLDMRRVQSVDVTAVHLLSQIRDSLAERGAFLVFSGLTHTLPNGRNLAELFERMELTTTSDQVKVFAEVDDGLEWIEDQILGEQLEQAAELPPLEVYEMQIFRDCKEDALVALVECLERRSVTRNEKVFSVGDAADRLYLIRKGAVRITTPVPGTAISHHRLTYGRGDFVAGLSFIRRAASFSADATAMEDTELYVLSRASFEKLCEEHRRLAFNLMEAIAQVLAMRLSYADKELLATQD